MNFQTFFIMYFPCERQITSPISTNFLETTGTSNQKSFNQNLYIALLFELPAKHTRYLLMINNENTESQRESERERER